MAMERMRVVFYGINGQGLGHLSRLLHIGRALRELAQALSLPTDISFLTSSEAPQIAWDFPVYKIPSKTVLQAHSGDVSAAKAHNRFFISNLLGTLRPHQVVMDTLPQGSWGEFTHFRDYCRQRVFVNRTIDPNQAEDPIRASHLALYDLILCPDLADAAHRYPLPPELSRAFTGAIHGYQPSQAWGREYARQALGVRPEEKLIYLSAGGGGDPEAVRQLQALIDTLSPLPQVKLLVAYGPLYRGPITYGPQVIAYQAAEVVRYFAGLDLAFSATGYNSYHELRAAGVPTAFFAQPKGMDRQDMRLAQGLAEGWCLHLESFDAAHIMDHYHTLLAKVPSPPPYQNGASRAAGHLLRLYAKLPGQQPLKERVPLAVLLHDLWQAEPQGTTASFGEVAAWALAWAAQSPWALEEQQEQAHAAWRTGTWPATLLPTAQAWLAAGKALVRLRHQATDIPEGRFRKLMARWAAQEIPLASLGPADLFGP